MFQKLQKLMRTQIGQGLVEYALIIFLVAIVVVAVLAFLGTKIQGAFSTIAQSV